jgi:exopolysaccharide biosynthesis protein
MKNLYLRVRFAFVFLAFLSCLTQAVVIVSHPYQGITYISRTETLPRDINIHIFLVDLTKPGISFKLTQQGGSRDTIRQTTLDFLNQEHAQVAINCHFFLPYPSNDANSNVVGLAASHGNVYSPFEPQPIREDFTDQSYAIIPFAPGLNIEPNNAALIVHRNAAFADNKHVLEPVKLWNAVSGSAQIITNGAASIPKYTGSAPVLKSISGYSDDNSWYSLPKPRTAIGLTRDNRLLVLFTVDGAGGSSGLTVGEVCDFLIRDYVVYNALNLDGGGSTTLAMEDPATHIGKIVNVPSEDSNGRSVGSSLVIFADDLPSNKL